METNQSHEPAPATAAPASSQRRRPGEAAAFLVTLVLLVAIALLGLSLWKTIGDDFQPAGGEGGRAETAPAAQGDEVVLTVNGSPIRESEMKAAVASLPEQMRGALATEAGREALAEELIRMELLEQYAREKNLQRQPDVAARLEIAQGNILANAALRDLSQTQAELTPKELYEQNRQKFETVSLSQIVVSYEGSVVAGGAAAPSRGEAMQTAAALAQRVRGGADFAAVAREASADRQSAERGGDIGPLGRGTFGPEVEQGIFDLPVGSITDPIETPFGIHVFKITGKQTRSFEEVEQTLLRSGRQIQMENAIETLRDGANVDFNPEFFPNKAKDAAGQS